MASHCRMALLAALLAVLLTSAAEASRGHLKEDRKDGGNYLVQGKSRFQANLPKDPTPLAPTTFGPYAIAHRGLPGHVPEHTVEGYNLAIAVGADFVECDMVLTKDAKIICRHEPNLSNTTNANDIFPDRIRTYTIDFQPSTGVHAIDLTLDEVKQLRARERLYDRDHTYDNVYSIPTLDVYFDTLLGAKRIVGAYPETKHPTWHDSFKLPAAGGKSFTQIAVEAFKARGYKGKLNSKDWLKQPIFIQSFETKNLREVRSLTDSPIVQLVDSVDTPIPDQGTGTIAMGGGGVTPGRTYGELLTNKGLDEVAQYADAIGSDKNNVCPANGPNRTITYCTNVVDRAHQKGLNVHLYTARNEPKYFASNLVPKTVLSEFELFFQERGVDGFFADFSETTVAYLGFRRQNPFFPKRQIFPIVDTSTNSSAHL